jgi:hypothetical protein
VCLPNQGKAMAAGGDGVAQQAELRRIEGNACFKKARLGAAIDCYTEASSPRPASIFHVPLTVHKTNIYFFPRLWLWHQIKNVSFAMKPLIGNRALPRRRRLLDESGPMPFQAQVSS